MKGLKCYMCWILLILKLNKINIFHCTLIGIHTVTAKLHNPHRVKAHLKGKKPKACWLKIDFTIIVKKIKINTLYKKEQFSFTGEESYKMTLGYGHNLAFLYMLYSFNTQNLDWTHANKFCEDKSHEKDKQMICWLCLLEFLKEFLLKSIH